MSLIEVHTYFVARGMQEHRFPLATLYGDPRDVDSLFQRANHATRLNILQRLKGTAEARVARLAACRGLSVDVVCDLLMAGNQEAATQLKEIRI